MLSRVAIRQRLALSAAHNSGQRSSSVNLSLADALVLSLINVQRFFTSSSTAQNAGSQSRTTAAAIAATAVAIGSSSWYYYAYGRDAYAMTPQEEGLVKSAPLPITTGLLRADTQIQSLHPIQYPWEHEKVWKTFDHQTYALIKNEYSLDV